mmetsp:Transcript_33324/g.72081  ORF Transcript_33324/g.72081 Transcript_33324/m.72081 type:complete len:215 (+) Transcript_33324:167-811(+)
MAPCKNYRRRPPLQTSLHRPASVPRQRQSLIRGQEGPRSDHRCLQPPEHGPVRLSSWSPYTNESHTHLERRYAIAQAVRALGMPDGIISIVHTGLGIDALNGTGAAGIISLAQPTERHAAAPLDEGLKILRREPGRGTGSSTTLGSRALSIGVGFGSGLEVIIFLLGLGHLLLVPSKNDTEVGGLVYRIVPAVRTLAQRLDGRPLPPLRAERST